MKPVTDAELAAAITTADSRRAGLRGKHPVVTLEYIAALRTKFDDPRLVAAAWSHGVSYVQRVPVADWSRPGFVTLWPGQDREEQVPVSGLLGFVNDVAEILGLEPFPV